MSYRIAPVDFRVILSEKGFSTMSSLKSVFTGSFVGGLGVLIGTSYRLLAGS